MTISVTYPLAFWLMFLYLTLDVVKDLNRDTGFLEKWWPYAENRWMHKYRIDTLGYDWQDMKWWAKLGGTAFIDLWHTCKTLQLWILLFFAVSAAGLPVWSVFPLWVVYGAAFSFLYHNR